MSVCLRTRILQTYIRCLPWKRWKGEIELLPVSSKTLFSKSGLSIDLLEIDLREEGFLLDNQCLLEFLKDTNNLKNRKQGEELEDISYGLLPEDWTEEDYEYYEKEK